MQANPSILSKGLGLVVLLLVPAGGLAGNSFCFGVLQDRAEHLERNRAAGANITVVSLSWDQAEPQAGQFCETYFRDIVNQLAVRRKLGYAIALDLGFQYPPQWVLKLPNARYINQYGQSFSSSSAGENIPNAVFNQVVRGRQEAYLSEVFRRLGSDFKLIRLGWMKYGELAYPVPGFNGQTNCYWAFDHIAQGRSRGLADGLSACPVPGWIPGRGSSNHLQAAVFIDWYIGALQNYHDWQISTVRKYTASPLAMLYPSWGMRSNSRDAAVAVDLNGSTSSEINGEVQRGLDFERLVSGIRDPRVYVYCTWIDSSPRFSNDAGRDPRGWAPSHYLASLAAQHSPALQVWGENTGGGDVATVELCFQRIRAYGYSGFLWAFEPDLYDGQPPEIGDFKSYLREE